MIIKISTEGSPIVAAQFLHNLREYLFKNQNEFLHEVVSYREVRPKGDSIDCVIEVEDLSK